jgi:gliding motility-associated-like protein
LDYNMRGLSFNGTTVWPPERMKGYLLYMGLSICIFCFVSQVQAQTTQTFSNGQVTPPVNFTASACTYNWVNNNTAIGLPASGTGLIPSFTAINTGITPVTANITATPQAAGVAYIPNYGDGTVSVLNTSTNAVVATIPVGLNPYGVTIGLGGGTVYVTNEGSNTVSEINTATNTVTATIPINAGPKGESGPSGIIITPKGTHVYVADVKAGIVSVINPANNSVINVTVGANPSRLAVSPDGSVVYVTNNKSNTVSVISTVSNTVIGTIKTGMSPLGICVSSDGKFVYIGNTSSASISVVNTANYTTASIIPLPFQPFEVTISPDGGSLYATYEGSAYSIINTATAAISTTTIAGSKDVAGISFNTDGSLVYITDVGLNNVSVISTATNAIINTTTVGANPFSYGNFTTGCSPVYVTIIINSAPPVITAGGVLAPLTTTYGTASASTGFTVSATNLSANILVTPPPGFEVSTDNINFTPTATIGDNVDNPGPGTTPGTITNVPVYIRLTSTAVVGTYPGNVVLSTTNTADVDIPVASSIVNPAPLTVTADNKSRPYDTANPVLTVSYSGFVNNENTLQLTILPQASTTANTSSAIGQYPITVSGLIAANYTPVYMPGVLTVKPAGIGIPNAFTPNGDGINDNWDLKYIEYYPNCTVDIYNRYGEKLYSSIGYATPWNGKYKGEDLPAGTYYYIINPKNGTAVVAGYVAIIR